MTLGHVDLSFLTNEEKAKITEVLQRDEQIRELELKRVRNLREEVKNLRLKGTIREGNSITRACARCRQSFGMIFNTGSICPKCQFKVCKKCQEMLASGKWICVFCFSQMEYEAKSGNWFYTKYPRTMRDRSSNEVVSGAKIVKDAITEANADDLDSDSGEEMALTTYARPTHSSLVDAGGSTLQTGGVGSRAETWLNSIHQEHTTLLKASEILQVEEDLLASVDVSTSEELYDVSQLTLESSQRTDCTAFTVTDMPEGAISSPTAAAFRHSQNDNSYPLFVNSENADDDAKSLSLLADVSDRSGALHLVVTGPCIPTALPAPDETCDHDDNEVSFTNDDENVKETINEVFLWSDEEAVKNLDGLFEGSDTTIDIKCLDERLEKNCFELTSINNNLMGKEIKLGDDQMSNMYSLTDSVSKVDEGVLPSGTSSSEVCFSSRKLDPVYPENSNYCSESDGDLVRSKVNMLLARYGRKVNDEPITEDRTTTKQYELNDTVESGLDTHYTSVNFQVDRLENNRTSDKNSDINNKYHESHSVRILDGYSSEKNNFGSVLKHHDFADTSTIEDLSDFSDGLENFSTFGSDGRKDSFCDGDLEWDSDELADVDLCHGDSSEEMETREAVWTEAEHNALRDLLSVCMPHASSSKLSGSPPETDGEGFLEQNSYVITDSNLLHSLRLRHSKKFTKPSKKFGDADFTSDDTDDCRRSLSVISEHSEPDSIDDDLLSNSVCDDEDFE